MFTVTPTAHSNDVSPSSPIVLATENALANSKQPQLIVNLTHGSSDVEGDLDLSPGWEYREVSLCSNRLIDISQDSFLSACTYVQASSN